MAGKKISVEFDGVYMNSNTYVNGHLLGNHPYAYTGFAYGLTGAVHTDGVTPNVIAVQASNQIPSSRWYSGSGIYRNVRIVITDPVHIARHDSFVTTPGAALTVPAGQTQTATTTLRIDHPSLWSTEDPSLYTLETEVSTGGRTADSQEYPFGIRFFECDRTMGSHSTGST